MLLAESQRKNISASSETNISSTFTFHDHWCLLSRIEKVPNVKRMSLVTVVLCFLDKLYLVYHKVQFSGSRSPIQCLTKFDDVVQISTN